MAKLTKKSIVAGVASCFCGILVANASATVITFDDLPAPATGTANSPIPNGYAGLNWNNFSYENIPDSNAIYGGTSGYTYGLVSGTQDAFNGSGTLASMNGSVFSLTSGYFTGAWNYGLLVTVSGYRNGVLVGTDNFTVSATSPTLESLNLNNIDTANFTSSGGTAQSGFNGGSGTQFVLDNLTINGSVPEPGSAAIFAAAAIGTLSRRSRLFRSRQCRN